MKVQVGLTGDRVRLTVTGRLAESYVSELEKCWRTTRADHAGGRILVDLIHVTFIDDKGRSLLERMHRDGATFAASGLLTRDIVDKIVDKITAEKIIQNEA